MPRARNVSHQTRTLLTVLATGVHVWRHGYELSKLTGLKSGTLYPLLIRLSDQGLLESKWMGVEHPGRPPRHVYRLTPSGLAFAQAQVSRDRAIVSKRAVRPI